jgi:ribosome recycling factor
MADVASALADAQSKMDKAVEVAKDDFATIRTGRAHPALFNKIMVDYYGTYTPLSQLASIQVPEARMAIVSPFDKGAMASIEKAIRESDLGVNPGNDGVVIRVALPQLSIRNIRRSAKELMEKLEKDGDIGKDDLARGEKELEKVTSERVVKIDELLKHKEAELLEV